MFSLSSTVLTVLAASLLTTATPIQKRSDYPNAWQVTGYTYGCSPGGCVYNFNVSSAPLTDPTTGLNEPAFTSSCTGPVSGDLENYQPQLTCTDLDLKWKLDILPTIDEIYISHFWAGDDGECQYNATGTQGLAKDQKGDFAIVDFTVESLNCNPPSK